MPHESATLELHSRSSTGETVKAVATAAKPDCVPAVPAQPAYRLSQERYVVAKIKVGDGRGARALLNKMLGEVLVSTHADLEDVKTRVVELLVVISRAVIEGGGPEIAVLRFNTQCVKEIMAAPSIEKLYSLIGPALDHHLEFVRTAPMDTDFAVVRRACDFLAAKYAEKLSVAAIAKAVYVSPHHLCRLFRRELSESVMGHLTDIRVDHAKRLLETTAMQMDEIAKKVGLTDSAHFCRVFKRVTGLPPAHYRRQFGGKPDEAHS